MTLQEAYEKQRAHFTAPGAKLARLQLNNGVVRCYYRGSYALNDPNVSALKAEEITETSCAVGCLIPDGMYDPEMDNLGGLVEWQSDLNDTVYPAWMHLGLDSELTFQYLADTQTAHDTSRNATEFVARLDEIAATYGLEVQS